jgi:hypothetical protein
MTTIAAKPAKGFTGQYLRVLSFPYDFNDANTTAATAVAELPPGAIPLAGALAVTTAANSSTNTVAVTQTDMADANSVTLLSATDIKTVAVTAINAPAPVAYGSKIKVTFAKTGSAATAGAGVVYLPYILPSGADFSQGDDLFRGGVASMPEA